MSFSFTKNPHCFISYQIHHCFFLVISLMKGKHYLWFLTMSGITRNSHFHQILLNSLVFLITKITNQHLIHSPEKKLSLIPAPRLIFCQIPYHPSGTCLPHPIPNVSQGGREIKDTNCLSFITSNDSLYFRINFPLLKLKTRTCRSPPPHIPMVANNWPFGESVMELVMVLA